MPSAVSASASAASTDSSVAPKRSRARERAIAVSNGNTCGGGRDGSAAWTASRSMRSTPTAPDLGRAMNTGIARNSVDRRDEACAWGT